MVPRFPFLAVIALALVAPQAVGASADEGPAAHAGVAVDTPEAVLSNCAPPCGEINPRLLFDFPELTREPIPLAAGDSISFTGTLTYWFDADDEGYTPPDPQAPIVISFSFPRLPAWAQMSIEPAEIPVDVVTCPTCFQLNTDDPAAPQLHYEYPEEVTLTVDIVDDPANTPGYEYGKLQLFAKSTESGIYNPGYGIREVRVQAGEPLEETGTGLLGTPGPGPLAALVAVGLAALVAAVARRHGP